MSSRQLVTALAFAALVASAAVPARAETEMPSAHAKMPAASAVMPSKTANTPFGRVTTPHLRIKTPSMWISTPHLTLPFGPKRHSHSRHQAHA